MKPRSLPDTLSGLLACAIDDARQLDRSLYLPYAGEWHVQQQNLCQVCLSGAVMASSLEADPLKELSPSDFPQDAMNKLFALNRMRCGDWITAWHHLYGGSPSLTVSNRLLELPQPQYCHFDGWEHFEAHLRCLEALVPHLRTIESLNESC